MDIQVFQAETGKQLEINAPIMQIQDLIENISQQTNIRAKHLILLLEDGRSINAATKAFMEIPRKIFVLNKSSISKEAITFEQEPCPGTGVG